MKPAHKSSTTKIPRHFKRNSVASMPIHTHRRTHTQTHTHHDLGGFESFDRDNFVTCASHPGWLKLKIYMMPKKA